MTRVGDTWKRGDKLPPIGTTLQTHGGRDYVLIRRTGPYQWVWAVNNHRFQDCTIDMLLFWQPMKISQTPQ